MKPALDGAPQPKQARTDGAARSKTLSMAQVAQLSGISEADLPGLVEYGVLVPATPAGEPRTFDIECVMTLQCAELLRHDLALDNNAFALAVMFLNQITRLETDLHNLRSDLRGSHADGSPEDYVG